MVVDRWTGTEVKAVRVAALRCTQLALSEMLGCSKDAVYKWERRGDAAELDLEMSAAMDTVLTRLTTDQRKRFEAAVDRAAREGGTCRSQAVSGQSDIEQTMSTLGWNCLDDNVVRAVEATVIATGQHAAMFGARATTPTFAAQLDFVDDVLMPQCPPRLHARMSSARGRIARELGWAAYDRGDYTQAVQLYQCSRADAHTGGDWALAALVLANMARLELASGPLHFAADHAAAAMAWSAKTSDLLLGSYCAAIAAKVAIAGGAAGEAGEHLARAQSLADQSRRPSTLVPFFSGGLCAAMRARCLVQLGDAAAGVAAAESAVRLIDDRLIVGRAYALISLAEARAQAARPDQIVAARGTLTRLSPRSRAMRGRDCHLHGPDRPCREDPAQQSAAPTE
ncbi:hypothetical protein [Nocardia sp. NPDC060249]|uniref:hypothetical protein n=1 Tax=Nocardia sp. NPDC060249 TaxID=3347082 RepID=UPI0036564D00